MFFAETFTTKENKNICRVGGIFKKINEIKQQGNMTAMSSDFSLADFNHVSPRKSQLKREKLIHNRGKPFLCSDCGFSCSKESSIRMHMFIHSGVISSSLRKPDLSSHLRTDGGRKLFSCFECDYTCLQKSRLESHLLTHSGEKPFSCSECNFSCAQNSGIKRHMLTHNGLKPFSCADCNYACSQKAQLQFHVITHNGVKPFSCSDCNFVCSHMRYLKRHRLIHSTVKPFPCSECSRSYTRNSHLKRHQLSHAREMNSRAIDATIDVLENRI